MTAVAIIVCIALLISTTWSLLVWLRELAFYRRSGWDFEINNPGASKDFFRGDSSDDRDRSSNRDRVLFARPFFIAGQVIFLFVLGHQIGKAT